MTLTRDVFVTYLARTWRALNPQACADDQGRHMPCAKYRPARSRSARSRSQMHPNPGLAACPRWAGFRRSAGPIFVAVGRSGGRAVGRSGGQGTDPRSRLGDELHEADDAGPRRCAARSGIWCGSPSGTGRSRRAGFAPEAGHEHVAIRRLGALPPPRRRAPGWRPASDRAPSGRPSWS